MMVFTKEDKLVIKFRVA